MMSSIFSPLLFLILCSSLQSCDITHECPVDNQVIFASNGSDCHIFLNECFLNNVNCHHQNNNLTQLKAITKDECQRFCITKCPEEGDPVCGYYNENGERHTFANQCEMEANVCKTGKTLFGYGVGPCESPDSKDEGEETSS